jgi:hypothetical protein
LICEYNKVAIFLLRAAYYRAKPVAVFVASW